MDATKCTTLLAHYIDLKTCSKVCASAQKSLSILIPLKSVEIIMKSNMHTKKTKNAHTTLLPHFVHDALDAQYISRCPVHLALVGGFM